MSFTSKENLVRKVYARIACETYTDFVLEHLVQLGLSNFAAWEVAEVWNICNERGWVKPTVYQAMYNAISKSVRIAAQRDQ